MHPHPCVSKIIIVIGVIACAIAFGQPDQSLPPITTPWDFNAYEHETVVLWRVNPETFRVSEVMNWKKKTLWKSEGFGDVIWAFQDSLGNEIGAGFYYIRIQESDAVHWASMKVYWHERTMILEHNGHRATLLVSGPDAGTGFSATVSNKDTIAWQLTELIWWYQSGREISVLLERTSTDSTESKDIVLLPYGVNAYQVRLIAPELVRLDSLGFRITTQAVDTRDSTVTADP